MRVDVGGDLKYLLTSNLTLDATFNPDFGQVEVDPASLNLSAFETYYDEKRPFFIAGASAFDFGGFSCMFCSNSSSLDAFYSRRIGRPPQVAPYVSSAAAYADLPDNAAILGAAKITGRTQGGYTVGILDAVTNRERARYVREPGQCGNNISLKVSTPHRMSEPAAPRSAARCASVEARATWRSPLYQLLHRAGASRRVTTVTRGRRPPEDHS